MQKVIAKWAKLLAVFWLFIISFLFFLPGSALPKENCLDQVYFDKWVHFGFFALLLFLWRFYLPISKRYHVLILVAALAYGTGVEYIQHYFIANRSFDLGDVIADMAGALAGVVIWDRYIKK
jgi:VanZ family protein